MARRLLIGSLVSAAFLLLAMRGVEWSMLWSVLKRINWPLLLLSATLTMVGHYTRAIRWRFMMTPLKPITTASLFSATAIGLMANNLLPARLGEFVRAYVLGRKERVSKTAAFATIVYERVVDVFSLLVLLWLMLLNVEGPDWLQTGGIWMVSLNVALLVVLIWMHRDRSAVLGLGRRLSSRLPQRLGDRARTALASFVDGLASVASARAVVPIAVMSVLVWGFPLLGLYYCLLALGMHPPFMASIALAVLVPMATMIPSAPAYLGTIQYACVVALAMFDIGRSEALAYSLAYHASHFFPITFLGLFYLWKEHIGLGEIRKESAA